MTDGRDIAIQAEFDTKLLEAQIIISKDYSISPEVKGEIFDAIKDLRIKNGIRVNNDG